MPVVPVTETLPTGKDYLGWMTGNVDALRAAAGARGRVHPTSEAQAAAHAAGSVPPVETVRDGVFAIAIPLGHPRLPSAFSYAIEDAAGAIISSTPAA